MRWNWRTMITAVGLAATLSTLGSGCVVSARARLSTEPVYVVEEAPPPPREERIAVRPGYVWIRGRWEYRGGRWIWGAGHWQRERAGHAWQPGHWARRGGRYHWVEGRWVAAGRVPVEERHDVRDHRSPPPSHSVSAYPVAPPPAARPERVGTRAGYVWVAGHYRWENGAYAWVPGHWERARRGWVWESGHWERRGGHYAWIDGRWRRR